jgi:hypothetical protein
MTTPAGCISLTQDRLRHTLASCAKFRTFCGAADYAEALEHIHHDMLPAPANGEVYTLTEIGSYRPYAIVSTALRSAFGKTADAMSDHYEFAESGRLWLYLVREVPAEEDNPELDFKNHIGQIIDELCDYAGQAGYLALERITLMHGPVRGHHDFNPTEGEEQMCHLEIAFDQGGG